MDRMIKLPSPSSSRNRPVTESQTVTPMTRNSDALINRSQLLSRLHDVKIKHFKVSFGDGLDGVILESSMI